MLSFVALKGLGKPSPLAAQKFIDAHAAYVETDLCESLDIMIQMVLSGSALIIGSSFEDKAIIVDARTYPSRSVGEPQNDRVMLGARDGFIESLIFNTALIRRRIRDTALTMKHFTVGSVSKTDVVLCYMSDRADKGYVDEISKNVYHTKAVIELHGEITKDWAHAASAMGAKVGDTYDKTVVQDLVISYAGNVVEIDFGQETEVK